MNTPKTAKNKKRKSEQSEQQEKLLKLAEELQKYTKTTFVSKYVGGDNEIELETAPFFRDIAENGAGVFTGFENIDTELGGLHSGLIIIGGNSGVGKTALAQQLAFNISSKIGTRQKVIYVSLEMGAMSLTARYLANFYSQVVAFAKANNEEMSKEALPELSVKDILEQKYLENEATQAYMIMAKRNLHALADNLILITSSFALTIDGISVIYKYYNKLAKANNEPAPVLIVDYLQAISPSLDTGTDKQQVDYNIQQLKRLQADHNNIVICLTSLNRQSYNTGVEMSSAKESGGIEYTADMFIGLELFTARKEPDTRKSLEHYSENYKAQGIKTLDALHEARLEYIKGNTNDPRPIEFKILKDRIGFERKLYFTFNGKTMRYKATTRNEALAIASRYDFNICNVGASRAIEDKSKKKANKIK